MREMLKAEDVVQIARRFVMDNLFAVLAMLTLVGLVLATAVRSQEAPGQTTPPASTDSEKHVHNYADFDKSCRRWTDRCRTCSRETGAELSCSNIGIACTPAAVECLEREKDPEKK
jgi:hypothetical protein